MTGADGETRRLALCLAALAGFVDATGFLMLGGFFVSFMSGNTTRLAVGIVEHAEDWKTAGMLIVAFFTGVMASSATGRAARSRHSAVIALVAVLLLAGASLGTAGLVWPAALCLATAMGAENAVFEQDGEVRIGLTYMTGTLVKTAQRLVGTLMGEGGRGWRAHALLWLSLTTGAVLGALTFGRIGNLAIWAAAFAACACIPFAARLDRLNAKADTVRGGGDGRVPPP